MILGPKIREFFITISTIVMCVSGFVSFEAGNLKVDSIGSFNSNLLQLESLVPILDTGKQNVISDVPMLSFLPYKPGNPRSTVASISETVGFQVYFNNSGDEKINNPSIKTELIKENATTYRLKATLFENSGSIRSLSSEKGGDLVFSVPTDSQINIVGNSTRIFKNALTEFPSYPSLLNIVDGNLITDNEINNIVSNPIFSDNGYKIADTLEPGGLKYGFITSKFLIQSKKDNQNKKPVLDDQQLIIERGVSGFFKPYLCIDENNNLPCAFEIKDLPPFCVNNKETKIISCNTSPQTPVTSKFTITPVDSENIRGDSSEYLINVTDSTTPSIDIEKKCTKKDTDTDCNLLNLTQGDIVKFSLKLKTSGNFPVNNVKVVEAFDKNILSDIADLTPEDETSIEEGTILINLGNVSSGESKEIVYSAKIKEGLENGKRVVTKTKITSDNASEQIAQNIFTINLPGQLNLSTSHVNCVKKDTNITCDRKELSPGDTVTYRVLVKNSGTGVAYNVKVFQSYKKDDFELISNINPTGFFDPGIGNINWSLGSINGGETKELTFDAKINQESKTGNVIISQTFVTSDGYPNQNISDSFILPNSNNMIQKSLAWWQYGTIVFLILAGILCWLYLHSKSILRKSR